MPEGDADAFFSGPPVLYHVMVIKSVLELVNIKEVLVSRVSVYKRESV